MQTVSWFDLTEFGARLKVVPMSPLRGVRLTCIEVFNSDRFSHAFEQGIRGAGESLRDAFDASLKRLDFTPTPVSERIFQDDPDLPSTLIHRFYSTRTQLSLDDLKTLIPDLSTDHFKPMSTTDIVLSPIAGRQMAPEWEGFIQDILSHDARGVWVPRIEAKSYKTSGRIMEPDTDLPKESRYHHLIADNCATQAGRMVSMLNEQQYRENSLISYYANPDEALADGWQADELEQRDLPHAFPLWVTAKGRIVAISDILQCPELTAEPPSRYLRMPMSRVNGIIVGPLRDAKAIEADTRAAVERLTVLGADAATLKDMVEVDATLNASIRRIIDVQARHPRLPFSFKYALRLDPGNEDDFTRATPKALAEMERGDRVAVASQLASYAAMDNTAMINLSAALQALHERAQDLAHNAAIAEARSHLETLAVRSSERAAMPVEKHVHVDVGVKIGGARKDFAKRALNLADLASMNQTELGVVVNKRNIWAPYDYQAMRDAGVTPQAALALKLFKDAIETKPTLRRGLDSREQALEDCAEYITAISTVRDAMANVKTLDDMAKAIADLYLPGAGITREEIEERRSLPIYGHTPFQTQIGQAACNFLVEAYRSQARGLGNALPHEIASKVRKKMEPNAWFSEAEKARFDDEYRWSHLIKKSAPKSEAELEAKREKARFNEEMHRPHLEHVKRDGRDWRQGRNVTGEDLIEHFGFRGIEYGNWLPQDERQDVINMAYDSFCDLADVLNLPPRAMSLGGDLALAFGARGTGGAGAALAHFEPARTVINMTRMNGAGCLAHEWFHALDRHLGKGGYQSVAQENTDTPMGRLVWSLRYRPSTREEVLKYAEHNIARNHRNIDGWLSCVVDAEDRPRLKEVVHRAILSTEERFLEVAERRIAALAKLPESQRVVSPRGVIEFSEHCDAQEHMMGLIHGAIDKGFTKKYREGVESNVRPLAEHMGRVATIRAADAAGITLPASFFTGANRLPSSFSENAKKLDKTRSEEYWDTTVELFARAGAAWVNDLILSRANRSDYLVYGTEAFRHENNAVGNPNPPDSERPALAEAFTTLVDDYRLSLTNVTELEMSA